MTTVAQRMMLRRYKKLCQIWEMFLSWIEIASSLVARLSKVLGPIDPNCLEFLAIWEYQEESRISRESLESRILLKICSKIQAIFSLNHLSRRRRALKTPVITCLRLSPWDLAPRKARIRNQNLVRSRNRKLGSSRFLKLKIWVERAWAPEIAKNTINVMMITALRID
jgi:hypothetical protein